jgi:hypothetical protein
MRLLIAQNCKTNVISEVQSLKMSLGNLDHPQILGAGEISLPFSVWLFDRGNKRA